MAKDGGGGTRIYAPTHKGAQTGQQGAGRASLPRSGPKKTEKAPPLGRKMKETKRKTREPSARGQARHEEQGPYTSVHRLVAMDRESLKQAALRQIGKPGQYVGEAEGPEPENARLVPAGQKTRERAKRMGRAKKQPRTPKKRKPMDTRKLLTALTAGIVLGGLVLAGWFVFLTDTVEVNGNHQYPAESIVSLTGLVMGRHMLLTDLTAAKEGIESNPYLKVLSVERKWPRTIRITVEERQEAAVVRTSEYDVVIDIEGHVLSIGSGADLTHLVQLIGISQGGFQVNKPIGAQADYQTQALMDILSKLKEYGLMEDVALVDVSNPLRTIIMTRDGVQVVLGEPTKLPEKLTWMKEALPSLQLSGITGGTLDVSAKGGAIYSRDKRQDEPAPNEPTDEPPDEPPDEPTDEPPDEPTDEPMDEPPQTHG